MEKYIVIAIQGYEVKLEDGRLVGSVEIQLMENDINVALKRAKKLIKKPFYRVSNIVENYVKS